MFTKGQSGNPKGRPPRDKANQQKLRKILYEHGEALIHALIEQALAGEQAAMRIVIDRLIPAWKAEETPVRLKLDLDENADVLEQVQKVIAAFTAGTVEPGQLAHLISTLGTCTKINHEIELEQRLQAIEAKLPAQPPQRVRL